MRFVIVTGLSGSGKSCAVRVLEDIGYFVVDNMMPSMIKNFAEIAFNSHGKMDKIALVCDIRSGKNFDELADVLDNLKVNDYNYEVLFLEASDEVLIKRYKETRRKHPFSRTGLLSASIAKERGLLEIIKKKATYVIDTSEKTPSQLKKVIETNFADDTTDRALVVNIISFGFKHGLPLDCDLVFDVRFLPNPFYLPELKKKNGTEEEVAEFVFSYQQTQDFLEKLKDMIDYLLPFYEEEGKTQLAIGIGCTGGQHRSVAISELLYAHLWEMGQRVYVNHREMSKWPASDLP